MGLRAKTKFQDSVVRDPRVIALRKLVTVKTDPAVSTAQCDLIVRLKDGRVFSRHIETAIGSLENRCDDAGAGRKFPSIHDGILPRAQAQALMALCWKIEQQPDAGALARAAAI